MLPNTIQIVGTVKRDAFVSGSGKFAAVNVEVECGRDRAWLDVVGFEERVVKALSGLKADAKIQASCHPQSNKGKGDSASWRLRFIANELKVVK